MEPITQAIAEMLEAMRSDGCEPPFYWAAIGANGTVVAGSYQQAPDGTLDAEISAEHVEGPGFAMPVNIMLVDQVGKAFRVTLRTPSAKGYA